MIIIYVEPKLHTFCAAGICLNIFRRQAISTVVWFHDVLKRGLVFPLLTLFLSICFSQRE